MKKFCFFRRALQNRYFIWPKSQKSVQSVSNCPLNFQRSLGGPKLKQNPYSKFFHPGFIPSESLSNIYSECNGPEIYSISAHLLTGNLENMNHFSTQKPLVSFIRMRRRQLCWPPNNPSVSLMIGEHQRDPKIGKKCN